MLLPDLRKAVLEATLSSRARVWSSAPLGRPASCPVRSLWWSWNQLHGESVDE